MKRQGFARAAFVVLGTGVLMLCGGCFSAPDPGELSLYDVPEYFRGEDQYVLLVEAENFEADYDIEIDYREAEDGVDFDKIIDDIAEGSEKYDIYAVRATMADAVRIQEKHAYADLSGSEILTGIVSKMYGTVAQSLWQGEELFAMPWEVDGEVLCYNPTEYPQYTQEDYQNWDSPAVKNKI